MENNTVQTNLNKFLPHGNLCQSIENSMFTAVMTRCKRSLHVEYESISDESHIG